MEKYAVDFSMILSFGLVLVCGYVAGRVANFLRLPKVTGYITAGILLEPSYFGVIPEKLIEHSAGISNVALCIITYAIGGSLNFRRIKKLGNSIWVMTLFESVITFLLITAGLYILLPALNRYIGLNLQPVYFLPLAVLAGSLGAPTDPTPTLAVKEEYKAEGPVTTTILGIGAFDDAMGIIIFSIATAIGVTLLGGSGGGMQSALAVPFLDIALSLSLGIASGAILLAAARKVEDRGVIIVMILGALFTCFGLAQVFSLDELLCTMTLGCVVVNFARSEEKFFMSIRDDLEELVFVVFFVIAGAQLQVDVLLNSLWIVLVFVVFRIAGKFLGSATGAYLSGAEPHVRKYAAFGLVPQGGIVVGLALLVKQDSEFRNIAPLLINMIIGTTVLFEFIGPLLTEFALHRAGETRK